MSLQSIGHFQKAIYEILQTDHLLKTGVNSIYLSTPQDAKYPFIVVSLLNLKDISKFTKKIYEMEFEISLFTRERVQEPILLIADHIVRLMNSKTIGLTDSYVISMKKQSLEWVRGHDFMHNKVEIKYRVIIGGV